MLNLNLDVLPSPKPSFLNFKLLTLNALSFLLNTSSSLLAPYYPIVASNYKLSNYMIGLVLASHAIGSFFFSLLLTKTLATWGRRNLMIIGVFLHLSGNAVFGSIDYFPSYNAFLIVSLISRFIQGIGYAAFTTASLAIIPLIFRTQEEKIEAYVEVASSVGVMMGPLVGSFLYVVGGYQTPFFCLAGLEFLFMLALPRIFLNDSSVKLRDRSQRKISIRKVFWSKEGVFGLLVVTGAVLSYNFMDPSLSYRLGLYQVSPSLFGVYFTLSTLTYLITMFTIDHFSTRIDKRVWMSLGVLTLGLGYYFLIWKDLWGLSSGLVVLGIGSSLILIPALQQYRIMAFKIFRDSSEKEGVNDVTSGMFGSASAVGELLGPIVGGILVDQFGFTDAVKWFGIGTFGFFLLYLYVGDSLIAYLSVTLDNEESKYEVSIERKVHFSARRFTVMKQEN